jgi:sugar phosphate permease
MACASAFNAMNLVFVTQRLQVSTEMIGPINIAVSVGTLLGSFLAGLLMRWIAPRYMFAGGILVLGIGVTLYSQLSWYWPALICIGLATLPQSGVDMGLGPMLVTSSPPDLIGRAQSVVETSMLGSGLVATALAGFVVQFLPVEFIIASAGLLAVLSGVIALYGLRRQPAPNQQGPSR